MHGSPTALRGEEVGRSRLRDVGPGVVMKTFGMKLCGIVGMARLDECIACIRFSAGLYLDIRSGNLSREEVIGNDA